MHCCLDVPGPILQKSYIERPEPHMHVVAILICHHKQSSECVSVLELHGLRGMQHGEAAHTGDESVAQHAHAQQGSDSDGCHKAAKAQIDHLPCTIATLLFGHRMPCHHIMHLSRVMREMVHL